MFGAVCASVKGYVAIKIMFVVLAPIIMPFALGFYFSLDAL
jgi:hypothetical protein